MRVYVSYHLTFGIGYSKWKLNLLNFLHRTYILSAYKNVHILKCTFLLNWNWHKPFVFSLVFLLGCWRMAFCLKRRIKRRSQSSFSVSICFRVFMCVSLFVHLGYRVTFSNWNLFQIKIAALLKISLKKESFMIHFTKLEFCFLSVTWYFFAVCRSSRVGGREKRRDGRAEERMRRATRDSVYSSSTRLCQCRTWH